MIRYRSLFVVSLVVVVLLLSAALVASCGGRTPAPAPTEAPDPVAEAVAAAEEVASEEEAEEAAPAEEAEAPAAEEETEEATPAEEAEAPAVEDEAVEDEAEEAAPAEETEEAAPEAETEEAAEEEAPASGVTSSGNVDMDAIFPPGEGRQRMLIACTGCHNWVPMVILGLTEEEWERSARTHRDYVSSLSDEDFELVYDYLKENFGPETPIPDLPQPLLEAWTSY